VLEITLVTSVVTVKGYETGDKCRYFNNITSGKAVFVPKMEQNLNCCNENPVTSYGLPQQDGGGSNGAKSALP
jgi:hypothetical protein